MMRNYLERLEAVAAALYDGHLTIMRFTTNWRVGFGSPYADPTVIFWVQSLAVGDTFAEAARNALQEVRQAWDRTRRARIDAIVEAAVSGRAASPE